MAVRKRIMKTAAKIYAANLVINALGTGADSDLMSLEERGIMGEELNRIADRIMPNLQVSTLDEAIQCAIAFHRF